MILKGFLPLLTFFYLLYGARSDSQEDLFEITDIKSIKNFILEHYNTSRSEHLLSQNVTWDEKNKTAGDIQLEMTTLVGKLSAMKSKDDSSDNYWWDQVLKVFKPKPVSYRDGFNLFNLNGRLKTARKAVNYDVRRLDSLFLTSSLSNDTANNCLHSWALNWYSVNHYSFAYDVNDFYTDVLDFDNIRQVFYDMTLYLALGETTEDNSYDHCQRISSFHQGLYNLYRQIIINTFKEFSVQYFSYMGEAACSTDVPSSYIWEFHRFEKTLKNSLKKIMESTKGVLHDTTYYMYLCDPVYSGNMNEDQNIELEKMVQAIIIAEKDLSTTQSCSHNCNLDLIKDTINKTECGDFLDCHYSMNGYQIIELTNSSRRYTYFTGYNSGNGKKSIQYGKGGRQFSGHEKHSDVYTAYSWTMRFCDYCICSCVMKPSRSSHVITAISFRDQVSDIDNNRAILGFKFVKKDYMIHIQILEGEVLPHGKIGFRWWKPLEKFDYNEKTQKYYVLNGNDSQVPLELGVDYGHPNIMNLNDVMAPEKHIITGVRFRFAGDSLDSPKLKKGPIELQIRVTPLDFVKGKLINLNQSSWISPKEQLLKDELTLQNPDHPYYATSNIDSTITTNKFVKFRASDLEKDAGQSTVPFLDGREVRFYDICLLGGVGLIHRGPTGSGGYLAFKIFDFDMSSSFNIIDD